MQENARLAGKSDLIAGGGGGIGAATAALVCAQGAAVILVDASAEALAHTAAQIAQDQPQARVATFCADVSDPQLAQAAVRAAVEAHGGLDILVNNAATRNYSALADVTPDQWHAGVAETHIGSASWREQEWQEAE